MKQAACFFFLLTSMLPIAAQAECRAAKIHVLAVNITEELVTSLQVRLDRTKPIQPTSFVDFHNLDQTSDLGKILGDEIGTQLSNYGYCLLSPQLRSQAVSTGNQQVESILSPNPRQSSSVPNVQAYLLGTYANAGNGILISAKLVSAKDKIVLAAATCELQASQEGYRLMSSSSGPDHPSSSSFVQPLKNLKIRSIAREIQQRLMTVGFYRGKIDGVWGKKSREALQRFKISKGLPAPSVWDQAAQLALFQTK